MLNSANSDYLAKNINLAQKISDGMKIYIPSGTETVPIQTSSSQTSVNSTQPALMNINTASLADLDKLPGIGVVTAQKIIDSRPYLGLEELVTKKAVGRSVYEKIEGMITI